MRRGWLALIALVGCGGGTGEVQLLAWGEDVLQTGHTTTDGWTVTFDHWLTGLEAVELTDPDDGEVVARAAGPFLIDWVAHPDPVPLGRIDEVPARRLDVGFATTVPEGAEVVDPVPSDRADELVAAGGTHRMVGQATDGTRTVSFDWTFDNPVAYTLCRNGLDDTPGLAIPADGVVDLQITLHSDHVLWDQVGTEEADLVFGSVADADADQDGTITRAELDAVSTLDAGYETGGFELPDLGTFMRFATAQALHVNGGGLCQVRAR
jgi:hypothetical protein